MKARTFTPAGERAQRHIGERWGRWTVIGVAGYPDHQRTQLHLRCQCECGRVAVVSTSNLTTGRTTQCRPCGKAERRERAERWRRDMERASRAAGFPIIGWRKRTPLYACPCCGQASESGRCRSSALSIALADRPLKYPASVGIIARRAGVSHQYVYQLIGKHGWRGMRRRLAAR